MGPFRDLPQPVHSARRCYRFRRCAVCAGQPSQVLQEFLTMVHRSWSTAERDFLSKAARSALLLPAAPGSLHRPACSRNGRWTL
jgi:hypothetical protein